MLGTIYYYFASITAAESVPQLSVGDRAGLEYLKAGSICGSKRSRFGAEFITTGASD